MATSDSEIQRRFAYHQPRGTEVVATHQEVREHCAKLAVRLNRLLPESREKSLALTKVQEAMWAANAAVALHMNEGDGVLPSESSA